MTDIIPANSIDYRNVDEICAYQTLLCKIYECEGGFNLPVNNTPATREISRQSLIWLREVKALIESILRGRFAYANLGDMPRLLQSYDVFYRIAYGSPCLDYLREVKIRTANRWEKGDRAISKTDVVLLLLSETDRNIRGIDERYAKLAISTMSCWIEELVKEGEFKGTPLPETYRRLSYLLNADLRAYMSRTDEAKAKAQWMGNYILTDKQIAAADTATLWAYANFIDSMPFTTAEDYERKETMYMHILSILASRPHTHPHQIKAIELTFKRREALIA